MMIDEISPIIHLQNERFQGSDFRFPISDFCFQISDFRFQIPVTSVPQVAQADQSTIRSLTTKARRHIRTPSITSVLERVSREGVPEQGHVQDHLVAAYTLLVPGFA
eukprot:320123-Rhodomonas_salina.2